MFNYIDLFITTVSIYIILIIIGRVRFKKREHALVLFLGLSAAYFIFILYDSRIASIILSMIIFLVFICVELKKSSRIAIILGISLTALVFLYTVTSALSIVMPAFHHDMIVSSENSVIPLIISVVTLTAAILFSRYLSDVLDRLSDRLRAKFSLYIIGGILNILLLNIVCVFLLSLLCSFALDIDTARYIAAVMLVVFALLFYITVYALILAAKNEITVNHKDELLADLQSYTDRIEKMYNKSRIIRHDYNNIIYGLYGYIKDVDMDGLKGYFEKGILPLNSKTDVIDSYFDKLMRIKIPELRGLTAIKLMRAADMGCVVNIEIHEDITDVAFDKVQLCRAAGILIDNAAEECENNKDSSSLTFSALKKDDTTKFIFTNSVHNEINTSEIFKEGYSTKGCGRGLGLHILQDILNTQEHTGLMTSIEEAPSDKHKKEFVQVLTCKTIK